MKSCWVIHPLLVAIFPTIFLFSHNVYETNPHDLIAPLVVNAGLAFLAWSILGWLLRSMAKAGIILSLFLIFFYSWSHTNQALNDGLTELSRVWVYHEIIVPPKYILGTELALLVIVSILAVRPAAIPRSLTKGLNGFALLLVCIPTTNTMLALRRDPPAPDPATQTQAALPSKYREPAVIPTAPTVARKPDIYYIILDGYARSDIMQSYYGYDVEGFLGRLEKRGFYVARNSRANYCQTPLCLSSSLNCKYLDEVSGESSLCFEICRDLIGKNAVAKTLKQLGYTFVTFSTGFDQTDHPEADLYLSPNPPLSAFQWMLVSTTPLASMLQGPAQANPYVLARKRTLFLLDKLPAVAQMTEPTFTFAHIVCPHPPFVFGENGEDVSPYDKMYRLTDGDQFRLFYGTREEYIEGYRKQATYITNQVEKLVDRILANSAEPPIIILQSDHGSGLGLNIRSMEQSDLEERMSILNAYYLPYGGREQLYDSISPVNSFRVVLNRNFGANLPLLPDRSYYSTWPDPLKFIDVTDRLKNRNPGPGPQTAVAREPVMSGSRPHESPRTDLRFR